MNDEVESIKQISAYIWSITAQLVDDCEQALQHIADVQKKYARDTSVTLVPRSSSILKDDALTRHHYAQDSFEPVRLIPRQKRCRPQAIEEVIISSGYEN